MADFTGIPVKNSPDSKHCSVSQKRHHAICTDLLHYSNRHFSEPLKGRNLCKLCDSAGKRIETVFSQFMEGIKTKSYAECVRELITDLYENESQLIDEIKDRKYEMEREQEEKEHPKQLQEEYITVKMTRDKFNNLVALKVLEEGDK